MKSANQTSPEFQSPDPALRKIGWAGLLLDSPRHFRFARLHGDAKNGLFNLADDNRVRLEVAWARVRRAEYDGQRFALKRLRKIIGQSDFEQHVAPVQNPAYDPLLHYKDPEGELDRYVGYCPRSRRVIEMAYHLDSPAQDLLIRKYVAPGLRDQSTITPQRWTFFDVSFIAPPKFRYESSRLNLGDMRVRMISGTRRWNSPRITVGQIYPAKLALKRQDVSQWVRNLAAEMRSHYRPAKGKVLAVQFYDIPQGRVAQADLKLRRRFWPFLWRTPRQLRLYVIHHHEYDRLTFLNITDFNADRIAEHFDFVSESLHWAGMQS